MMRPSENLKPARRVTRIWVGGLTIALLAGWGIWHAVSASAVVTLTFLRYETTPQATVAYVQITNAGRRPVAYAGDRIDAPMYACKILTATGWTNDSSAFCATGTRAAVLPSAQSAVFRVQLVHTDCDWKAGVGYTPVSWPDQVLGRIPVALDPHAESFTAWTPVISKPIKP